MAGYIGNAPIQVTQERYNFTATASQTTFTLANGYIPNYIDVYLNGVHLLDGDDFTATDGSDVVLSTGATLDDIVEIVAFTNINLTSVTGATGGGSDQVFYNNGQTVNTNYTIPNGQNSMSSGPITIADGVTVTVGDGEVWTIV